MYNVFSKNKKHHPIAINSEKLDRIYRIGHLKSCHNS
jgi:hypothetical protein